MIRQLGWILLWAFLLPWAQAQEQVPWAQAQEQEIVPLSQLESGARLDPYLYYLEDAAGQQKLTEVLASTWKKEGQHEVSLGYSDSAFWFRLTLHNDSAIAQRYLLDIAYPVLDQVDLYASRDGDNWNHLVLGDKQPFAQRVLVHRNFIFPVDFAANERLELIFRVKTSSAVQFPLSIWRDYDFFLQDQKAVLAQGFFYGLMLVMVFYNLFIFISVRDSSFLFYVLYAAANTLFFASLQGFSFQLLWPNATQWNDTSIIFSLSLTMLFGVLFTLRFLKLWKIKKIYYLTLVFAGIFASVFLAIPFAPYAKLVQITMTTVIPWSFFAIIVSIVRLKQGYTPARFYILSWSTLFFGGILMALAKMNLIENGFLVNNMLQIGTALEMMLLSFALADLFNHERQQRSVAQRLLLEQEKKTIKAQDVALRHEREARQAQSHALAMQKQATEVLDQRVKERTCELENLNKQLQTVSVTDALTQLYNRRYFDASLRQEVSRALREKEPLSVIMLDIDHFKLINDRFGHQLGDEVLKAVAAQLQHTLKRSTDTLARYGGEEFVLTLPNTDSSGAQQVAENLRQAIASLDLRALHPDLRVSVSLGLYGAQVQHEEDGERWLKYADTALYQAKAEGRNCVRVFTLHTA